MASITPPPLISSSISKITTIVIDIEVLESNDPGLSSQILVSPSFSFASDKLNNHDNHVNFPILIYHTATLLTHAGNLFDEIPQPIVNSVDAFLSTHIIAKIPNFIPFLFIDLSYKNDSISPNALGYGILFKSLYLAGEISKTFEFGFAKGGELNLGSPVQVDVIVMGFNAHLHVANELVFMYAYLGVMDIACKVFDGMTLRTVASWGVLVVGSYLAYLVVERVVVITMHNDKSWICCDLHEQWFHGKCVKVSPARADHIKQCQCPSCSCSSEVALFYENGSYTIADKMEVLQVMAFGILGLSLLKQRREPIEKMASRLLRFILSFRIKFYWSNQDGESWRCLILLTEILLEKFSNFYSKTISSLFHNMRGVLSVQVLALMKTNMQLLFI